LRYYYYLQSTDQVAAQMGIPAATVRSRLARGREILKQKLSKEELP
jgi:DNA-directed RNA polymerase specialized sigma24 family protein